MIITGATSGVALATVKLFVEECAYVFITGRRKDKLDEAIALSGSTIMPVQGDAPGLDHLDDLYATIKREKGKIDILSRVPGKASWASSARSQRSSSITVSPSTRVARSSRQAILASLVPRGTIGITRRDRHRVAFPGFR